MARKGGRSNRGQVGGEVPPSGVSAGGTAPSTGAGTDSTTPPVTPGGPLTSGSPARSRQPTPSPQLTRPRAMVVADAASGVIAAAVALAISELLAGLVSGIPSLVISVGSLVISLQPPGAKDFMTNLFGTNDKLALNVIIVIIALILGSVFGTMARRQPTTAIAAFVGFGAIAVFAAIFADFASPALAIINALIAVGAGLWTLRSLLGVSAALAPMAVDRPGARAGVSPMPDWARRQFLIRSAGFAGVAIAAGGIGRYLLDAQHPASTPVSAAGLPAPSVAVTPLSADESLTAADLTPLVISNDDFYRIDTALLVPQVDAGSWQLMVTGMVDHPLTFTYNDLLAMPLVEQYVTIQCVSNVVGGDLVGNALWTGVRLKEILANAGVQNGATQIIGRSIDGFTVGFPVSWAMAANREPMVVVGMNRVPLPAAHGYPARLIIPGLYGYVSATKWLTEIQLTTDQPNGYWVDLGWAKDGPILTESRIDHPANADVVPVGNVQLDGLAWAPDRGVSAVQVRIDNGAWQPAEISRAISKTTWVQWLYLWNASKGDHQIEVRAIDGTGAAQTDQVADPFPAGATGYHTILVQAQ